MFCVGTFLVISVIKSILMLLFFFSCLLLIASFVFFSALSIFLVVDSTRSTVRYRNSVRNAQEDFCKSNYTHEKESTKKARKKSRKIWMSWRCFCIDPFRTTCCSENEKGKRQTSTAFILALPYRRWTNFDVILALVLFNGSAKVKSKIFVFLFLFWLRCRAAVIQTVEAERRLCR